MFTLLLAAALATAPKDPSIPIPDQHLTPGAVFPTVTRETVCKVGYTKTVRNVPASLRRQVFAEYELKDVPGKYEVDHLISLELGGSNDIKNLWPEPYEPRPGAREKDVVETKLHRWICSGTLELVDAQRIIVEDWYACYQEIKSGKICKVPDRPLPWEEEAKK